MKRLNGRGEKMKNLKTRLAELPEDASISEIFKVISKWEDEAVKEYRKQERTTKSGRLHYRCYYMHTLMEK